VRRDPTARRAHRVRRAAAAIDVPFENRVEDLLREETDIAIRVMSEPPQSLVARELGPVRFVACASREFYQNAMATTLEELTTAPLITSNVAGRQWCLAAHLDGQRHEVTLEPTLISENFLFLRQAVLAGLGVGIVADYVGARRHAAR